MSTRPLNVVQLVPSLVSGGVERGTLEVARELVRLGHRSVVISGGGRLVAQLVDEGSEHLTWPIGRKTPLTIGCVPRLRQWLRRQRIDIVHARSRIPAWVGWLAWRTLPPSVRPHFLTTMHGLNSVNAFSRIMTRGEVVVAVSEAVRTHIRSHYPGVPDTQIRVIQRGIDPAVFPFGFTPSAAWQARWQSDFPQFAGRRLLTLAGRTTRLKGHHDFLTLISDLKSDGHPVHGLIVGDEDPRRRQYAAELRQRVVELDLQADVTFLGHRSDIREVYAASDVVLSLSAKPESFGRTTLEPLALGVPVVGYAHGGVGEILRTVFPSGAVPLKDRQALRHKVRAMFRGEAPAVEPFKSFRLQTMLDETMRLYADVTGQAAEPSCRRAA